MSFIDFLLSLFSFSSCTGGGNVSTGGKQTRPDGNVLD